MYKAIIFRPEADLATGKLRRFRQSRQVFYRNVTAISLEDSTKGVAAPIELKNTVLVDGANFVDADIWAQVEAHPRNVPIIKRMQDERSLIIATPDAKTIVNATSDFNNLGIVELIIDGCKAHNMEWLQRSMSHDQRPKVFKMIGDKIAELKEEEVDRRNRSKGLAEALV